MYVVYTQNRLIKTILISTLNILLFGRDWKDIPKLSPFASWPMIKSQSLKLPIFRTNVHGPKDVRAIEVRPHIYVTCTNVLFLYLSVTSIMKLERF